MDNQEPKKTNVAMIIAFMIIAGILGVVTSLYIITTRNMQQPSEALYTETPTAEINYLEPIPPDVIEREALDAGHLVPGADGMECVKGFKTDAQSCKFIPPVGR
ncbi:hypothetical protein KKC32_02480 [Patescibacteria group bacterium]|nr:hypothetical protein [Patescibacteria group bacterium]